jgi:hypothetical protein
MRTIASFLILASLSACSGAKEDVDDSAGTDDTAADSGDTGTDTDTQADSPFPLDATTVEEAYNLIVMPGSVYMFSVMTASFGDGVCPAIIEQSDTAFAVAGDCTATDGTQYVGSFRVDLASELEGTVAYDGWGYTAPSGESLLADGTHSLTSNTFAATGAESLEVAIRFPEDGGGQIQFSGVWTEFSVGLGGEDGTIPLNAKVDVNEGPHTGLLSSAGDFVYDGMCGGPVSGTVVLSGSQDVYLAPQGCDDMGCIPWTAQDGTSGEVCR